MKKIISLILALTMVFALAVTASAADGTVITIPGSTGGAEETFTAYKVFSGSFGENGAVVYTISEGDHFLQAIGTGSSSRFSGNGVPGETGKYYITNEKENLSAQQIIDLLLPYVESAPADIQYTSTYNQSNGNHTITIPAGQEGYYLILGTEGTGVILDTVGKTDLTLSPKQEKPTVDKKIIVNGQEVESTTVNIGDTVTFRLNISIPADATASQLVVHDVPDEGITINGSLTKFPDDAENDDVNYLNRTMDGCWFEVILKDTYVESHRGQTVSVEYTATINDNFKINEVNYNKVYLTYDTYKSENDAVELYSYGFNLNKTNKAGTSITGAEFILSNSTTPPRQQAASDGHLYWTMFDKNTEGTVYTAGATVEANPGGSNYISAATINAGNVQIRGLAEGTYYLHEIKAPDGYNQLDSYVTIVISKDGIMQDGVAVDDLTVNVINETGTVLPSTGGMGTTLFYILGGLMAVSALVILVTNKRMRT